ncbi:unnamed protein product, partial [Timema podura]|nr:unnamed protein product [Timema podura]
TPANSEKTAPPDSRPVSC